jgi:hypothetical protein
MSKSIHTRRQFSSHAQILERILQTAIDVIWSETSVSLLRYRCSTAEARFTECIRGGQDLFHPSSAFRIVSLGCA